MVNVALELSKARTLSGASFILFLPAENKIAYSLDDYRLVLASGEVRYRFTGVQLRVVRVEDFVKLLFARSLRRPRLLTTAEYAAMNEVDSGSVLRFCRSALGSFYGCAVLTARRVAWRIPEDVPKEVVLLGRLAKGEQHVPARDLIAAALHTYQGERGVSVRALAERLKLNYAAARKAVYELKRHGLVVDAGRGRIKLATDKG